MKKSRIIAPALAVLTLSTAAAVTGTVAWYFAQSKVAISSSAVTSFNPEPGLKVTLTAGTGTTVGTASTTNTTQPATVTHELMRDASVDMVNEKVYGANGTRSTIGTPEILSYRDVTANLKDGTWNDGGTEKDYYFATTYSAKFELSKKMGKDYALYYDNIALQVTGGSAVQESLRIGFKAGSNYFVIAPFRQSNGGAYVNGTQKTDVADYGTKVLYGVQSTVTQTGNDTDGNPIYNVVTGSGIQTNNLDGLGSTIADASKASYVGYLGDLNDDDTITATVYTWFEGSDASSLAARVDNVAVATTLTFTIAEII